MNITIHRGTHQIGGCVTEYEHNGWRIFVDCGAPLPGTPNCEALEIEGLTKGDVSRSALLITHYHGDHIGKLTEVHPDIPVYMGKTAIEIEKILSERLSKATYEGMKATAVENQIIRQRLDRAIPLTKGENFEFGSFSITPVAVDHSAYDAFAFVIKADKCKVFHTGDFRNHGFCSGNMRKDIEAVGTVNYIVSEGTNVSRPTVAMKSEHDILNEFTEAFKTEKNNIVYVSSTNIDRLLSLFHAARKAHRVFLVDDYQKSILDLVARERRWSAAWKKWYDDYVMTIMRDNENHGFLVRPKFVELLDKLGYVVVARANDQFKDFIAKLPSEHKQTYLSMWRGYVSDSQSSSYNKTLAEAVGTDYKYIHTSGHSSVDGMRDLIGLLKPWAIIPIHTESPQAFMQCFCGIVPVLQMNDGESFSPVASLDDENGFALEIIAGKEVSEEDKEMMAESTSETWWSDDCRRIGVFKSKTEAEYVMRKTVYKPESGIVLGYNIETTEDLEPLSSTNYRTDHSQLSTYGLGDHAPGKKYYMTEAWAKRGEKVYVKTIADFNNVIIPAIYQEPASENHVRKSLEGYPLLDESVDEVINSMSDWQWDAVVVTPLVKLSNGTDKAITDYEAHRMLVFPYIE